MKKILLLSVISILIFCAPVFGESEFIQYGYFKDDIKNRVFTYEMRGEIDKKQAFHFGKRRMNTEGQFTGVYFYDQGSAIPADGVTFASDMVQANTVVMELEAASKYRYVFWKQFNGNEIFVDCREDPKNQICKKSSSHNNPKKTKGKNKGTLKIIVNDSGELPLF
jgi:hypothetical protein